MLKRVRQFLRIRLKPNEPFITEIEKKEYLKLEKAQRRQNIDVYWQIQGRVENQFIEEYESQQKMKKANDEKKLRGLIVKQSFKDFKQMDKVFGNMAKRVSIMKKNYLQELARKQIRRNIVKSLEEESKTWLSNMEGSFEKVVIPNVSFQENDYFFKLQEKSLMLQQGNLDEYDAYEQNRQLFEIKNKVILGVFVELKRIIEMIRHTQFSKIEEDYQICIQRLKKTCKDPKDFELQQEKLKSLYLQIINKMRLDLSGTDKKINFLWQKMILVFNLMDRWAQYCKVLQMSFEEIQALSDGS